MTAGSPARLASHPAAAAARSSGASSRMAGALVSTREAYATTLRGLRRTASAVGATNSGPMSTEPPKRVIPADAGLHLVAKRPTNASLGGSIAIRPLSVATEGGCAAADGGRGEG